MEFAVHSPLVLPVMSSTVPIPIRQLGYRDIYKATKTFFDTSTQDPLARYLRNNRKRELLERSLDRIKISALLAFWIRTKVSLTVRAGIANVVATPPGSDSGRAGDPVARFAKQIMDLTTQAIRKHVPQDPEEVRRQEEFNRLMNEAIARTIRDRKSHMWYIDSLCTAPRYQGLGYGGALLDSVTGLADILSQATWLESSNIENTEFYNSHGFFTVAEVVVGEDNPTWNEKPVIVSIMIREPGGDLYDGK